MTVAELIGQFSGVTQPVVEELCWAWQARRGTVRAGDKELLFKRGPLTLLRAWRSKRPAGRLFYMPVYDEWLVLTKYAALTEDAMRRLASAGVGWRRDPEERAEYHWVVPLPFPTEWIPLIVDAAWGRDDALSAA